MLSFYLSVIETDEDKKLFHDLYEAYHDSIYKAALCECNNHVEDAEDLLQTTFTKVAGWIDKRHFIPHKHVYGWLITIMRNAHRDTYRTNEQHIEKVPYDHNLFNDGCDFSNEVIDQVAAEYLVSKLSEEEKDLLRMKYLGFSGKEMAEALGVTPATVRQRLKRTFDKLHSWYSMGGK